MSAFALAVLCLVPSTSAPVEVAEPVEVGGDVYEIQTRDFKMPLMLDPARKKKIERISLFVSENRGKSWKLCGDYTPKDDAVNYLARKDGLLWFALQTAFTNGDKEPPDLKDLAPAMKVYVNTKRLTLKPKRSYEELEQEVAELRKTVAELKKTLQESGPASKPK